MDLKTKSIICGSTAAALIFGAVTGCSATPEVLPDTAETTINVTAVVTSEETTAQETSATTVADADTDAAGADDVFVKQGETGGVGYLIEDTGLTGGTFPYRGFSYFGSTDLSDENEYPFTILISMGEQSTGGYSIEIVNIEYDGDQMIITVRETCPAATDMVTEAITYPCCTVRLTAIPVNIKVVNEAGEKFDYIGAISFYNDITDDWIRVYENYADGKYYRTYVYETEDGYYKYYNVEISIRDYYVSGMAFIVRSSGIAESEDELMEAVERFGSNGEIFYPGEQLTQPPLVY